MDLELKGKTAIVSASTAGIGYAIAERLAREGASVIVNGRTEKRVSEAVARIEDRAGRGRARGIAADLASEEGIRLLAREAAEADIVINNLGVFEAKDYHEITRGDWSRMMATNVTSGAELARTYLPGMLARGWGRIVFISSETAVNVPADMIHYGASKAAQVALSRGLAETTRGTGVTVNSVLPGPTRSEGVERFLDDVVGAAGVAEASGSSDAPGSPRANDRAAQEREFLISMRPTSLIQRFASADEVATLVAYLASPLSSATNGAALRVEGGLLRSAL